jgi:hypothetical protein
VYSYQQKIKTAVSKLGYPKEDNLPDAWWVF